MAFSEKDLKVYDDKEVYYVKNPGNNIVPCNKPILMEILGYIWKANPDSVVDETEGRRDGKWIKPKEASLRKEGYEQVSRQDWEKHNKMVESGQRGPTNNVSETTPPPSQPEKGSEKEEDSEK